MLQEPTLFPMAQYKKPDRKAKAKTLVICPEIIKRRQTVIYLLELMIPIFVFCGVIFSREFAGLDKIIRNQLVFATFIVIALLEIGLIAGSRVVMGRLTSLRVRIGNVVKLTNGRDSRIITLKDVARMTVFELPDKTPHTIAFRSFSGNMTLYGLNDMHSALEIAKTKIPDPHGRIVIRNIKRGWDKTWILCAATIVTAAVFFFARLMVNSFSHDLGGFIVVAGGVAIFAKPYLLPNKRWSAEIDTLCGGTLAASGLVLLLVDIMI